MRRGLALAALVAAAVAAVSVWRSEPRRIHVTAVFADVRGLVKGAEVRAAGTPVGHVDGIQLGADGLPRVRLAVDSSYPLRRHATAWLRVASLSGEFNDYVAVVSGTGPKLRDGAVLGLRSTRSPVQIDEALQTFDPRTRAELHAVLAAVDSGTARRGSDMAHVLRGAGGSLGEVAGAAGDVGADGAALRTLVSSTNRVAAALASRSAALGRGVDSMAALAHSVATRARELRASFVALPGALSQARALLAAGDSAVGPLRELLRSARPGLPALAPTARELVPVLRGARPALGGASHLVATAPADLRALSSLVGTTGPVLADLGPVLSQAGPMLDQARVRLPDAFSFFANWADFTSNYDANGHAARVGIVLPPASTRVLAPDSSGAGQLALPFLRTPGSLEGEPWRDYARSFVAGGRPAADAKEQP